MIRKAAFDAALTSAWDILLNVLIPFLALFIAVRQESLILGVVTITLVLSNRSQQFKQQRIQHKERTQIRSSKQKREARGARACSEGTYLLQLPPDIWMKVGSYLSPRALTNFACVNRSARELVDGNVNNTTYSDCLWRTLWYRDYSWLLLEWDAGKEALLRSLNPSTPVAGDSQSLRILLGNALFRQNMKAFYFTFGETFINYVLAGHISSDKCLFGLHGHIVDFTSFAPYHPGLSILSECGRDATEMFENVPHSKGARRIARRLCLVVNRATCGTNDSTMSHGVLYRPQTESTLAAVKSSNTRPLPRHGNDRHFNSIIPRESYSKTRRANTLSTIRQRLQNEQEMAQEKGKSVMQAIMNESNGGQLVMFRGLFGNPLDMRIYYDPFQGKWKGWYPSRAAEPKPVFCGFVS